MKRLIPTTALFCTFIVNCATAQTFQWAKDEGKYAYDYGYGIATDNSGNVYVAGKYEENLAEFSGTTIPCAGNHDMFLAKYSSSGALTWIRTGGGVDGDYAEAVACDKTNFVYVSGEIERTSGNGLVSFPGSTITLQVVGDNDAYLAKYDLDGKLIWAKSFGGINSEKALGITYDNTGNVYVCGYYTTTTTIGGTNITGYGVRDIYVAKFDQNGNFMWVRNAGSTGRDEAKFVKCDAAGNVYVCGMFSKGTTFGGQTINTFHSTDYFDAFLAKYAPDGTLQWVKTGGGDVDDIAWSLTIDNAGTIYIAGEFSAYAEFGSSAHNALSAGNLDVFVAAYDASGNVKWLKQAGGPLIDRARSIGTDGTNLFITGQFGSPNGANISFGNKYTSAADSSDIFIACMVNYGDFQWVTAIGGPADTYEGLGYESGNGVCADAGGNVYATGGILADTTAAANSKNSFGGSISVNWKRRTDVFVTKLTWDPATVGISENAMFNDATVYPNPTNGLLAVALKDRNADIHITNCLGQEVYCALNRTSEVSIDLSAHMAGVYLLEIKSTDKNVSRRKIVVQH